MFNISKIDTNFEVKTNIPRNDIRLYRSDILPFKIYGVFQENGKFRRIPENVAKKVSEGVYSLHANTAGGRVRFVTDSSFIVIKANMESVGKMPHFPLTGSAGFDLYIDGVYANSFVPPYDISDGYEGYLNIEGLGEKEIAINFPLYSDVNDLYIGLHENATIKEAKDYKISKPIVYYGSSITQGACASRPGMTYQAMLSRKFDADFINLGFSGNGKAEQEIVDYINNIDMSIFVMDYDHNSPSCEHLKETHEKMFKSIREKHPTLPVIMMSRPKYYLTDDETQRRGIIESTYKNALNSGDENVYFLDGKDLTKLCIDSGTVDNCHPTDFGFASIANALTEVIAKIII